ncbi:hypothetical protein AAFF_G00299590 [Aldrovandia affinis]|uniref:Uncharacterized protein n=1 Tax=Aldrovandia affinis TaxID=143900 RepID=A0AAD7R8E6_9TELE|nr:hypothetical protein AAFF_G00299590 [Aldrovandia affinis]
MSQGERALPPHCARRRLARLRAQQRVGCRATGSSCNGLQLKTPLLLHMRERRTFGSDGEALALGRPRSMTRSGASGRLCGAVCGRHGAGEVESARLEE